ncbi:MAG: Vitamin K-dependent gamma-carboxylase [uncultured Cytophagales bacterium]|uniref:Vitamin K-dependent gamma-carboxylase n=1 Tax=uncultured Cytophagales bacterium TaxID=158755 RepID=A0A6J4K1G0_9SPHI|nr:MAG: Vitamin K-dependent gamma-carboxylase [uncultured Cytophagales bacterium]
MLTVSRNKPLDFFFQPVHIAPLAVFRVLFGGVMSAGMVRFMVKGWVYDLYVKPTFYFTYYGFEWVKPLGEPGMYLLFTAVALSAFLVMIGFLYRAASVAFFLGFTYIELVDKTNYLNHYYFITLVGFLMALLPAGRYFSVDAWLRPSLRRTHVPRWMVGALQLQLAMVYFFAGIAKLNDDWLLRAMPLRIWLPPHTGLPLIGPLMDEPWVAYVFSWFGAVYDLGIVFLLLGRRTRLFGYALVLAFHLMTAWLFPIGMFPYVMILLTLVFFPESFHRKVTGAAGRLVWQPRAEVEPVPGRALRPAWPLKLLVGVLAVHFAVQAALPFRYLLYPGQLFWTEQGYRFSWRVMLMEKAGTVFFYVTDPATGREGEVTNRDFLTPNQEKMMATQPDMILQFAHFLADHYRRQGIANPRITAESYVTLNGSGSRPFLDRTVDLTKELEGFAPKRWILSFSDSQ